MAIGQDAVRRLTVVATDQGLTALNTKLAENERVTNQVAAAQTRMATAAAAADQRMQALLRNRDRLSTAYSQGGVGGAAGALGIDTSAFTVARIAPFVAAIAGIYASVKLVNALLERGSELLEKYANAHRLADRSDLKSNLESLGKFQTDTITAAQVKWATDLGTRLEDANWQIEKFFHTTLDVTNPALKLQSVWVGIVESVAAGAGWVDKIIDKLSNNDSLFARFLSGFASGARETAGFGPSPVAAPSTSESLDAARGRLGAAMGTANIGKKGAPIGTSFAARFGASAYDLANPPKEEEAKSAKDAWDRAIETASKNIAVQEAEAKAVGLGTAALAEYRTEAQLREAAERAGIETTGKYAAKIDELKEKARAAAQALAEARLKDTLGFERDQLGRNPTQQNVATRMRGSGLTVDQDSQAAQDIRVNEGLKLKNDLLNRDPVIAMNKELDGLNELLQRGAIDWETYGMAATRATGNAASDVLKMGGSLATSLGRLFNNNKAFLIAGAVMDTAAGVAKAIGSSPPPWNFVQAAAVAAAGAAQIATIRSAQPGGGGGVTAVGAAPAISGPAPVADTPPAQAINLTIQGKWVDADQIRELIEQINDYQGDGGKKIVITR